MRAKNIILYMSAFVILGIFTFGVLQMQEEYENREITVSSQAVSNKKIGWGIKREQNHVQPDLGKENKALLDQYNGIALGNKDKKIIYLTFDEGYEAGYTNQILDTLKEKNVPATFFITAHYFNTNEEFVKRMIQEGHIVGNHTVNHKSMPDLSDEQLKEEVMKLHQSIYEKLGYEMKYLRPPMGEYSQRTLEQIQNLGYKATMWSFAYLDYDEKNQPSEEKGRKMITDNFHNGEIMLLHGNSKTNTNVLGSIIDEAREQGYEFKSLDEFER